MRDQKKIEVLPELACAIAEIAPEKRYLVLEMAKEMGRRSEAAKKEGLKLVPPD